MARGVQPAIPSEPPLPKVSFKKVEDDLSPPPNGVHDGQARSYGYNDFSDFKPPDHYIRHIEPLEIDLARQVEYDMDEQDKEWLDALNLERKKEQIDRVSYEVFEVVMDRLEKEWFDLTKNIPKNDFALPSEDSTCAICDDSEGENSNAIVFCDGCNLAVHQDCYGVPYIPEGQWLCRKCTVSPENPVSCILCPNEGGAFKQTVTGEWVHLLCAIWVPETSVANSVFMEPVTGIEKISKQRWKLKCSLCDIREGACIQCAKTSCFTAFHSTCARKEKLLLPMKTTQGSESLTLTCYCDRHLPKEQQESRLAALAEEEEQEEDEEEQQASKLSKSARAYAKTYKPGPPLVPAVIVDRITQYIQKVSLRKKPEFLLLTCKYWSLKREARRGAPLLKRLHLEPWTANNGSGKLQSEEERVMRLEHLRKLRKDLQEVRNIAELTRKRESRKLKRLEVVKNVIDYSLLSHEPHLRRVLEQIVAMDRNGYFRDPVNKDEVPDYYDVVQRPMCWATIDEKLERHQYWDLSEFKDDVNLVFDNAILYNKQGSLLHKNAIRIKNSSQELLRSIDWLSGYSSTSSSRAETTPQATGGEALKVEFSTPAPNALSSTHIVGDLEPPLSFLDLLLSSQFIQDEVPIILRADPLTSLFQFELPKLKPPPPKPKKVPKPKPIRPDRTEEYARRKAKREAEKAEREAARENARAAQTAESLARQQGLYSGMRSSRRLSALGDTEAASSSASVATGIEGSQRPPLSTSSTSSSGARRRFDALPSHPEILDYVDNKESFLHFNSGWILPPDQKRVRRPTSQLQTAPQSSHSVDRASQPPPRKRMRMDPGTSRLSTYSTAEEDNQTLYPSDPIYVPTDAEEEYVEPMDVDVELPPDSSSVPPEEADHGEWGQKIVSSGEPAVEVTSGFNKIIIMPNGTRVLEQLDTPAIRREKNMKRKAEKEKERKMLAEVSDQQNRSQVEPSSSTVADGSDAVAGPSSYSENHANGTAANVDANAGQPGPSSLPVTKTEEGEFDPSSASESGILGSADAAPEGGAECTGNGNKSKNDKKRKRSNDDDSLTASAPVHTPAQKGGRTSTSISVPPRKTGGLLTRSAAADAGSIILKAGEKLAGGTLVWAKSNTFPWWPAVVFDSDNETVPLNIKGLRQDLLRKSKDGKDLFIVQFFDKTSSWQCIPLTKLRFLGEDQALDDDMLSKNSKRQKWKSTSIRSDCQDAYRDALISIEEDDPQEKQASNGQG